MDHLIDARKVCEDALLAEKRYNVEHEILASEIAIVDRLLARGVELADAYRDLHTKLSPHQNALEVFFGVLLSTSAFWNPDKMEAARQKHRQLDEVNRKIYEHAAALAELLEERSDLHDTSGFSSETYYDICDVILDAAQNNGLFRSYIQEKLKGLQSQFDMKYWPTLEEFASALASDAYQAESTATDSLTFAGTSGRRSSLADFFNVLYASIRENRRANHGFLPQDFKLKDETLAALANCALDLPADDGVDGPYVKRWRQRSRQSG